MSSWGSWTSRNNVLEQLDKSKCGLGTAGQAKIYDEWRKTVSPERKSNIISLSLSFSLALSLSSSLSLSLSLCIYIYIYVDVRMYIYIICTYINIYIYTDKAIRWAIGSFGEWLGGDKTSKRYPVCT